MSWARRLAGARVDALQLREKDLSDGALFELAKAVQEAIPASTPLLLNERFDVALAVGAAGVHLRADSVPLERLRRQEPKLLIGKSTHTLDEIRQARDQGADYVTIGPIFRPLSKIYHGPALGLSVLEQAVHLGLPVLAVGGVTPARLIGLARAGAAGFAAITLFQRPQLLEEALPRVASLWPAHDEAYQP